MKINQYQSQIYLGWKKFFFNFENLNLYISPFEPPFFLKTRIERQRNRRGRFWKRLSSSLNYNKYSKTSPRPIYPPRRASLGILSVTATQLRGTSVGVGPTHIFFKGFNKTNQNTYLFHRGFAKQLQWVQKGDLLADCSASSKGELALGKNLLAAYMPWEGLNFEDAVLINQKVITQYTSLHIEKYDVEILENEKLTSNLPLRENPEPLLEENGIIKIGSWVQEGDILVGKITSRLSKKQLSRETENLNLNIVQYEQLLYDIVGQDLIKIQENSLRVPSGISGRIIKISICYQKEVSPHIQRGGLPPEVLCPLSMPYIPLAAGGSGSGRRRCGSGRGISSRSSFYSWKKNHNHKRVWWWNLFNQFSNIKFQKFSLNPQFFKKKSKQFIRKSKIVKVVIYIATQRELKVGDKISGRHGNKGILSKIFGNYDMPFLLNGECLDILLNPLGVPSRMNVGQILECILGLTGHIFRTKFQTVCFDEMNGYEASRSLIYSKLLKSANQTKQKWLFSKKTPGKVNIFDGRDGLIFHQSVLFGYAYIMKLIHIVDEKINARSTGSYSLITQQPLRGRAKQGGQRVGEMEVWALQGFGSAYTLQELLTVKSDDLMGRNRLMLTLLKNTPLNFGTPESLRVVLRELQSLCLDLNILY
uniref:DNA-directed RNA polymerase n=1 Tax=Caulerpa sertularioides f. longipes TaxID=148953 RepID=A0A6B9UEK2_9CHLO|nr:RNA polymerase beta subunit [Caulerpa sertularioides f. longipes]